MKALNPTSRVSSLSLDKAAASREAFGSPSRSRAAGTPAQVSPTHRGRSRAAGGTQQGGCSLGKVLSSSWRGQELPEKSSSLGAAWALSAAAVGGCCPVCAPGGKTKAGPWPEAAPPLPDAAAGCLELPVFKTSHLPACLFDS